MRGVTLVRKSVLVTVNVCPPSHVAVKDHEEDESSDKEVTRNALSAERLN